MYFQATIIMNIGLEYFELISTIQKDLNNGINNFAEAILQIIKHFKFMEGTGKYKSVLQISQISAFLSKPTQATPIKSCKNPNCFEKV